MIKTVLAGAIALGFALPAFAQVETYYVVQDVKTKKCTIVDKKPMATEYTVVGGDGSSTRTASRPRPR